ncbi:MAG: elongation factor P [Candidatus Levybacteria bacterium RIFCSPLOWO2_02_FULL_37_10]|nr:MAG: elongation factor P [Candidatus Levybacteria bacterium RIFCSPHIGHO2_01_FULL_37_33]OGH15649.1 MAG: elongation factor P [Candidatus Levybacteria bacterium RIFCSPHIGHO2_02_FULL_37_11]OGH30136.1 MAG: elongation factor P [Candidatus Levybacteria bacterium RIFCSPHIGHO2_12_FULL_37_12]OGH33120.1 MAG: elongation factor P [Candidatus Levybacteria bacterium RIFCSPLOWO2_01_FULL_36_54]OGH43315.1 MAG: elongation factor P [Candidatus Levybacteria bacterium RIFCSPLOWO2_02_FULL_37_10]
MISVTDLRAGTVFEDGGQIFQVLSYEHIKMGRGSANIKVKVKDLKSGATITKSFINGSRVDDIFVTKKDLQFLYKDLENAYFMDPNNFEQVGISLDKLSGHEFLKEGENFSLSFYQNEPLSLNLAPKMKLRVLETGPCAKGNSATNVFKDAILENGITTKVPLFIKTGDAIKVDTRTGAYSEKA